MAGSCGAAPFGFNRPQVSRGLVAWWTMNDGSGTNGVDSSGFARTIGFTNTPAWSNAVVRTGINFASASTQYGQIASDPLFGASATNMSVCVWLRPNSIAAGTYTYLMGNSDDPHANGFQMAIEDRLNVNGFTLRTNSLTVFVGTAGNTDYGANVNNAFDITTGFHCWCVVYNGVSVVVYKDGVSQTVNASTTFNANGDYVPRNAALYLAVTDVKNHSFNGVMDDVRIYSRAITQAEAAQIYGGGYGSQ